MKEPENVISKMMEEHRYIGENVDRMENSMSDVNALAWLERESSNIMLSSEQAFTDKLNTLEKSLDQLISSLKKHFAFEEDYFLNLLDKKVSKELAQEHQNINSEFDKASLLIKNLSSESLSREKFLVKKMEVLNSVTDISHLIREHALKEDNILRMMKKEPKSNTGNSK